MSIQNYLKKGQVTIFSKSYCPFCVKIKKYFDSIKVGYVALEVDQNAISNNEVNELHKLTGCKTYPNVFIGLVNTKGCSETLELSKSGELFKIMDSNEVKYSN